ncbi:hypothetical protein ANN_02401 [Periplaneta americana]|uniref:Uncharacterized protein n=1 Tax=Periplaneta americana TaxID=6978 RepID=A0ABQ8TXU2_PERAM|nr:hypothetical protein ANN_02401 [Periplaneta americana]
MTDMRIQNGFDEIRNIPGHLHRIFCVIIRCKNNGTEKNSLRRRDLNPGFQLYVLMLYPLSHTGYHPGVGQNRLSLSSSSWVPSSGLPLHYVIDVYERRTEVHTCAEDDNNALRESAMRISYKICHEIAKELKTFHEGEFIKRCLTILADELCPQQVGEVEAIRLSHRTLVMRLQYVRMGQRERTPDYQKLRARVTHIWSNRRGQPNRSAIEGSHPGGTAFMITVTPTPVIEMNRISGGGTKIHHRNLLRSITLTLKLGGAFPNSHRLTMLSFDPYPGFEQATPSSIDQPLWNEDKCQQDEDHGHRKERKEGKLTNSKSGNRASGQLKYLGCTISSNMSCCQEVKRSVAMAKEAFKGRG